MLNSGLFSKDSLRKKCPYLEFFWFVFSHIQFKCRQIRTTLFTQRLSKFVSALKNTNKFEATALYVTYPKITEVKTMYESKSVNGSH